MKSPSERGATGAWAFQARQELGMSVEQVADAMAARGLIVSPATLRGIEGGSKKPGARLLKTLQQVLGDAPPVAAPVEGDVASAIREQAASNDRLAKAMETQAEAFTTLAASIDRASAGVVGTVGGFDHLLRDTLVAFRSLATTAPDEAQSEGPHAPVER